MKTIIFFHIKQFAVALLKKKKEKKKGGVLYNCFTISLSVKSLSMTTMVDRCSHTMRQKSSTVLETGA